jgi:hypothetical protein
MVVLLGAEAPESATSNVKPLICADGQVRDTQLVRALATTDTLDICNVSARMILRFVLKPIAII